MRKFYTEKENGELSAMFRAGVHIEKAARKVGRSPCALKKWAERREGFQRWRNEFNHMLRERGAPPRSGGRPSCENQRANFKVLAAFRRGPLHLREIAFCQTLDEARAQFSAYGEPLMGYAPIWREVKTRRGGGGAWAWRSFPMADQVSA